MKRSAIPFLTAALAFASVLPGLAQDNALGHDMSQMAGSHTNGGQAPLPEICPREDAPALGNTGMAHGMDEAHAALMDGMHAMNRRMMTGMTAEDIDVAFVCAMIPHHQSAIAMAEAELGYGDDEWARALAQKVIDAQQQEVAEMISWLERQSQ